MTLALLVGAWMITLWLAAGLCAAARLGDRTRIEEVSAPGILHRMITSQPGDARTIESQQRKCA